MSWSVDELAERLTMAGIEVEGIRAQGRGFENVIVAQILKSEPHPNADRLSVCEVETGSGKKQIVCGAKNHTVGDNVPLALVGAKLPNGMEIKRSKLRGVDSDGMMCSPKELGLAEDAQGLLILPTGMKVGVPFAEAMGLNDTLLDLEITPNRADLLSHWGLAREIAALSDSPPPHPHQLLPEADEKRMDEASCTSPATPVQVQDSVRCPRYTARVIRDVKVGPSPDWLRHRLEGLGQRSIFNIVDITNYVLLETGQPLHAFDFKLLEGSTIVVRLARAGEKLIRLDDETSELKPDMLVIADARRPVALAGVIGGKETGVSTTTTDILLESATFQPSSIRKTSKTLGISTDSSYRFERGVDIELAGWASKRATAMILQLCGGKVDGPLIDQRSTPPAGRKIPCRYSRVQALAGIPIPPSETNSILKRLWCRIGDFQHQSPNLISTPADGFERESCDVEPPSWRADLEREIDLIEEVVRLHGIQNILGKLDPAALSTTKDNPSFLFADRLRTLATSLGLNEAVHDTLVSSANFENLLPSVENDSLILTNPLSSEMDALRTSLLSGLLKSTGRNLAGGSSGAALFELGRIFHVPDGKPVEKFHLGMILTGIRDDGAPWEKGASEKAYDFHDLKGMMDSLLAGLGIQQDKYASSIIKDIFALEDNIGLILTHQTRRVAYMGKIKSLLAHTAKISTAVFYAELDCEWLQSAQTRVIHYTPWPVYPSVRRDIAMTVGLDVNHQHIAQTFSRLAKKYAESMGIFLEQVEIFDIFQSDDIGTNKKSLAYSLTYRSPKKTLTDAEANEIHETIKKTIKNEICCEVRE